MSDVLKNVNPSEGVEVVPFETTTSNNVVGHPDQDVESNNDNDHASSSFDVNPSNKNEKNRLFSLTKKVTTGLGFLLVIGAAAVAGASMSAANNSNIQAQQSQSATTAMPGGNGGSGKAGKHITP